MKAALTYTATNDYPDARQGMLDLYRRSYARDNSAFFDSFYAGNPFGEPCLFLCHDGDRLVGQENYLRQMVARNGRLLSVGLGVNTLIDSDYRLFHGVFGKLCKLSLEKLVGTFDLLCAYANEESKKYYLKYYGWRIAARVQVYKKVTGFSGFGPEGLLSLLRPGGERKGLTLSRTGEYDPAILDPVIEGCRAISGFTFFYKTSAFLNWKFLRNTHYRIDGYYLMSGERVRGYCLTYDTPKERRIIDILVEDNDPVLFGKALSTLSHMTRKDGLSRLAIYAVPGCWYEKTLKRHFFFRRWELDFIARSMGDEPPDGDWVIHMGDFDMF